MRNGNVKKKKQTQHKETHTHKKKSPQKTWSEFSFWCDFIVLHLLCKLLHGPSTWLHAATRIHAQEKRQENYSNAKSTYDGDSVAVKETREENSDGLPQGHNDGEDGSAELVDGVEDEELAARRTHGQQHGMKGKLRVTRHEGQRLKEGTLLQQRADGEEAGKQVDPKHHLHRRHLVLEQVVLPVGGEAVEDNVADEDDDPAEGGDGGWVLGGRAGQEEHADTHWDQHRGEVLPVFIALMGHNLTHEHYRNDFGGFGQNLSGEADVLEGLVLAPAAQDVGERGEGVLVHGCSMARLLEQNAPEAWNSQSQDTVHKDQELRVLESLALVFWSDGSIGTSHHPLLQDSPCQVRYLGIRKLALSFQA